MINSMGANTTSGLNCTVASKKDPKISSACFSLQQRISKMGVNILDPDHTLLQFNSQSITGDHTASHT